MIEEQALVGVELRLSVCVFLRGEELLLCILAGGRDCKRGESREDCDYIHTKYTFCCCCFWRFRFVCHHQSFYTYSTVQHII